MYQYPDYLMHHGVKGMKWGVRKKRYSGGVTKNGRRVSDRKAEKLIRKNFKKESHNRNKIYNTMTKEMKESKEFKEFDKALKSGNGFTEDQLNAALTKKSEIHAKYVDQLRSTYLKDIGLDDTKAGRDFVRKVADKYNS